MQQPPRGYLSVNVVYDDVHKLHSDPYGYHPERPERLELALKHIRVPGLSDLLGFTGTPEADVNAVLKVHEPGYVERIRAECGRGFHYIDPDTYVTEHTFDVATRFATSAYRIAVSAAEAGGLWLLMPRPGGHHAGRRGRAMGAPTLGFCIFNYAAIAARTLLERVGRVLVIDFDAHHGNGTQEIFWEEPNVLHVDIHEEGLYPGTGSVSDTGGPGAEGSKVNIPLPPGSGDQQYVWVVDNVLRQLIGSFRPRAIVVSAGFDAFVQDPLTNLRVTETAYVHIGSYLHSLVVGSSVNAVVTNLEGGYGEGLGRGLRAYLEGLTGLRRVEPPRPVGPPGRVVDELRRVLGRLWGIQL